MVTLLSHCNMALDLNLMVSVGVYVQFGSSPCASEDFPNWCGCERVWLSVSLC